MTPLASTPSKSLQRKRIAGSEREREVWNFILLYMKKGKGGGRRGKGTESCN